ncbi:uncharacterized protein FIESC28_02324 [Fusarium coffeatum]|uniref:Heterokaryon incompatibility domain-containing protein n=1 Tax=Fusarium coffeatum TaxID=231269 RepID=A0A366S8A1_9HYPO|nr:uncharacterized protein FIESC28_02324 [Fusarium coffeatum]RBR24906.1 hypothetical protein FIESC28_02324 [Fusarium coffeatum]
MDEIYSQALYTIVDAAGTDSNYGLAGFAQRRKPHRYAQVPGAKLIYLGTPPAEKVGSSPWGSRGWTYQEGFLSHRRIFFTDEQVVFQCNAMTCLESYEVPTKSRDRVVPHLTDTEPLNLSSKDFGKHLMEFSNRALSKDGDTLKAFLGVLNYFRKKEQCYHLYGNPIPTKKKKGHLINAWYHTKPGVRNAEYPSWSWTGWKGQIKTTSRNSLEYDLRVFKTRQRAGSPPEHRVGHRMSLDDYKKACSTNPQQDMEPVIELRGMMANVSFEVIKWNSEAMQDGAWAMIPKTGDTTYHSFLYLDEALTGICQFKLPVMVLQSGEKKSNDNIVILALNGLG